VMSSGEETSLPQAYPSLLGVTIGQLCVFALRYGDSHFARHVIPSDSDDGVAMFIEGLLFCGSLLRRRSEVLRMENAVI
jgi:hypothetical protein